MEATWTKLKDGSWGARVVSPQKPKSGDALTMKRSDGTLQQGSISTVVESKGWVHLCTLLSGGASTQAPKRKSRGTWTGCSCGSVEEYAKSSDCSTCRYDRD